MFLWFTTHMQNNTTTTTTTETPTILGTFGSNRTIHLGTKNQLARCGARRANHWLSTYEGEASTVTCKHCLAIANR